MTETEKQKQDRRRQEATVYRVERDLGPHGSVYRVAKRTLDVEVDVYHVTYKEALNGDAEVWCDCPGFRRQKFAKEKHKHVRAVKDYLKRGKPDYADYAFRGVGKHTKIRFIGSN